MISQLDKTPPNLTRVFIFTESGTGTSAAPGESIYLLIESDEEITSPTVSISSQSTQLTTTCSTRCKQFLYTLTGFTGAAGSRASFAITSYSDAAGNSGPVVSATTDGSYVDYGLLSLLLSFFFY